MDFIVKVIVGAIAMAVIDIPVIQLVIAPTLRRTASSYIAERPDMIAAGIFYIGYVSLVVYLTQQFADDGVWVVARSGALLGLLAYGTYEFTNKAVLGQWSWRMVAIDTTWGVILTAAIAVVVYWFGETVLSTS